MNDLAVVTGAAGGIGLELSRILTINGYDLLLVDNRADLLNEVRVELSTLSPSSNIRVLVKDLTQPEAAGEIEDSTLGLGSTPAVLINNAGFGTLGFFLETEWEREMKMLQLHMITLTHLTKIFLPKMVKSGRGRIMNVASVAGFQPSPLMAVYNASKAYVISFSEAIANEVKGSGVTITVLCPGLTRTGFQKVVGGGDPDFAKNGLFSSSPELVAKKAFRDMMRGKVLSIPGFPNKLLASAHRFLPRNLVVHLVRKIQERNRRL